MIIRYFGTNLVPLISSLVPKSVTVFGTKLVPGTKLKISKEWNLKTQPFPLRFRFDNLKRFLM